MPARAAVNSPASRLTFSRPRKTRGSAGSATGERNPPPTGNHSNREAGESVCAAAIAGNAVRARSVSSFFILARASPAVFCDVEDHAIGIVEFHLIKTRAVYRLSGPVRAAGRLDRLARRRAVVDQETHVVHADKVTPAVARRLFCLVMEQGDVYLAVAQVHAARIRPIGLADLLQAERFHVELGGLERIRNRDRDVSEFGHRLKSFVFSGQWR